MMGGLIGNRAVPPLSPAVQALLACERDVVSQPEIVTARAMARARESLNEQLSVTFAPRRAPTPMRRLVFAAAAGLLLTTGIAAAYQMLRQPHGASPSSSSRPVSHARPAALPESEPPAPAPTVVVTPSAQPRASGSAELQFLLRARQADARGDYAKVLSLLAQHQRDYPVGRLAEEREVLRVKALVGLGHRGKARQVAASFRRQFPRSVLLPKIDEMLAASR